MCLFQLAQPFLGVTNSYPKYCHLMLIFFKSWCSAWDLREEGQSWTDSFASFFKDGDPSVKYIMENIQLLQECKDSWDDHFAAHWSGCWNGGAEIPGEVIQPDVDADDIIPETDEHIKEAILHHLQSIDASRSLCSTPSTDKAVECLSIIEDVGLFSFKFSQSCLPTDVSIPAHFAYSDQDEAVWMHEYKCRKQQMKDNICTVSSHPNEPPPGTALPALEIWQELATDSVTSTAAIQPVHPSLTFELTRIPINIDQLTIDDACKQFRLNREQQRVFRIIVEHSKQMNDALLRMYVDGAKGTGKITFDSGYLQVL